MAGEIATAYIALLPSMRGFGSAIVAQGGPQVQQAGRTLGVQGGAALGASMGSSAARSIVPELAKIGVAFGVYQAGATAIDFARSSMVDFNAQLQQSSIGFETLLGSSQAAQQQMTWIKDFARETPFQYQDLVQYSQQLIALGFNAEESRKVLQASGDAAAALGRGSESIQRINLALGQMWTKGKVQSQEMLQLTEAGIGAWQILADAYGTSVGEVQDAVTKGLVSARDAVPALIAGMNAQFGGLMERQSLTYVGIVSNIQDTLQQQLAKAGEPLFAELTVQAREFLDALDDPEVVATMRDVGKAAADGVRVLAEAGKVAWEFRDGLVAIGVAVVASNLLRRIPAGSVMDSVALSAAAEAQRAYAAGLSRSSALLAGMSKVDLSRFAGVGQTLGLVGIADGVQRVTQAQGDGVQTALGYAEAIAGGALAGAAFGSVIPGVGTAVGAVTGAVVGLTVSLVSMNAALQASNNDTSVAQEALRSLGVDASLASLALEGVTNEQLTAAGGFEAVANAMKSGTFGDYVDGLKRQADALRDSADAAWLKAETDASATSKAAALEDQANALDAAIAVLSKNYQALDAAQSSVVATQYQAAYAADLQTGALGAQSEAAWRAVAAAGGLDAATLNAAVRMEGLAGVAGYATKMIAGIPTGTQINFSTNAAEIANQLAVLVAAQDALLSQGATPALGLGIRIAELQKQLRDALNTPGANLTLPGGSGVSKAVSQAASDAARKLQADRATQKQFAEAFRSVMEAAFAGDYDTFEKRLAAQITALTQGGYKKAAAELTRLSPALKKASEDYALLTDKIESATEAQESLTDKMRDQYAASRDLVLGLAQVSDAQSFDQLKYLLGETTSAASKYQATLKALKEQGLSQDLWNQLAQAGPGSAALAESILAQGQAGIAELNSLSGGLVSAADSMGTLVSESMYKQGADALAAYIDGLKSQQDALEQQLTQIANNVLTKVGVKITPGTSGLGTIVGPSTTTNTITVQIDPKDLGDLKSVQEFIDMLNAQGTNQVVVSAGTVSA